MAARLQPKAVLPFLPYGRQQVEADDIEAVAAVLRGDYLTTGPTVEAFEDALARYCGARFAIAVSSGTAGLHLAALALDLSDKDVVVVPDITFTATASGPRLVGAEVAFCDVDADTGLMTASGFEAMLGDRAVRAVLPVHLAGQCADMVAIGTRAKAAGLAVVEDACHALGAVYAGGTRVGSCAHSDMTVFSFHPVKVATTGEGGAVTTNDETLARRLRLLRSHGLVRDERSFLDGAQSHDSDGLANPWYYEIQALGPNYRITDIQCAMGITQLAKLDRMVERRAQLKRRYDSQLTELAPVVRPLTNVGLGTPAWHLCVVLIDFDALGLTRGAVMRALREHGVGTQVHYIPMHRQPYYRERYGTQSMPGADAYYRRTLSLPLYPAMSDADVDRVVGALRDVLHRR